MDTEPTCSKSLPHAVGLRSHCDRTYPRCDQAEYASVLRNHGQGAARKIFSLINDFINGNLVALRKQGSRDEAQL
jgi:hypothetical protein